MLILFAGGEKLAAQMNDAQLWLTASVDKRITPALTAGISAELRMVENITEAGTINSDIGLSYRLSKMFKVAAWYRFTMKRRLDDTYEHFNSWYAEGYCRQKFKPVTLVLRVRYQSKNAESGTSDKSDIPKDHLRTKLTIKYDLHTKYEPYIYAETYFNTGNTMYERFDELKLCAGFEYTFNRMHSFDIHYMYDSQYNVKHPDTYYVIGAGYTFSF